MATISVQQIEPGMVLAADLKDLNGRFLLSKGVKLSEKHLKIIKTWGVVEADIDGITKEGIDRRQTADIDPLILETAKKIEENRFIHTDLENRAVRHLFTICVQRRAEIFAADKKALEVAKHAGQITVSDAIPLDETNDSGRDPKKLIQNNIKLPSLPTIYHKINETIHDPRCSATHIGTIISNDPSLSARLLKLVNSAFYNFPSRIDTISRAVTIVGTKQLSTLSLGTSALTIFNDVPSDLIDMKSFWKHSIACGVIARILSSYMNDSITERFFVGGLLHDIGRLILFTCMPDLSSKALLAATNSNRLLFQTEESFMGFNHTRIGSLLMKQWNLPLVLENAVRYHHNDDQSRMPIDSAVIHVADVIANALGIGTSGERFVPPLNPDAWQDLDLSPSIFDTTIKQAERYIEETAQIFMQK